ncbi:hypothetical protein [Micromonospora sp. SL4-19]|uniref:hypothetical protein n=1 Tax=Micromonospora sp. SL4-19 TaxID=3399129 RepID=UPI003A4D4E72
MLKAVSVSKSYDAKPLFTDLDLIVKAGDWAGLVVRGGDRILLVGKPRSGIWHPSQHRRRPLRKTRNMLRKSLTPQRFGPWGGRWRGRCG